MSSAGPGRAGLALLAVTLGLARQPVTAPQLVGGDTEWQEVACGETMSRGRRAGGEVRCWGSNYNGAIGAGDADVELYDAPTSVVDLGSADALGLGPDNRACALLDDGSAWCWGAAYLGDHNVFSSATPRQVVERDELP